MKNNLAIYTAIFGRYDGLIPQRAYKGVDYLCFTDQDFESSSWQIVKSKRQYEDDNRNAKHFKLFPHQYLKEYDVSIWIDGNFVIRKNPADLIREHFSFNDTLMVFEHKRNCVYKEYHTIMAMGEKSGSYKDDPDVMTKQIERYRSSGYPEDNGLTSGGVIIRKHHDAKVKELMSFWWDEITSGSKRDQLSFQYSSWAVGFVYKVMPYYVTSSPWFKGLGTHKSSYRSTLMSYKLREAFGLIKNKQVIKNFNRQHSILQNHEN